jgi:hypothetical protein
MANIVKQKFERGLPGDVIGLHRVQLTAASDSITVPFLSSTNSVATLRNHNDPAVTATASDRNTITLTGSSGDQIWVVTHHPRVDSSEQRTSVALADVTD